MVRSVSYSDGILMKRYGVVAVLCLLSIVACEQEESGFGTVVIHARLDTGGPAGGAETDIVKGSTEECKTADQNGNATYERTAVGSWDVGFFENSTYLFAAGQPSRKTVDVENDKTVEVTFVMK